MSRARLKAEDAEEKRVLAARVGPARVGPPSSFQLMMTDVIQTETLVIRFPFTFLPVRAEK